MANFKYGKFKEKLLKGEITNGLDAVDVIALLVDTGAYTPNQNTHTFISDIPGAAILARSNPLTIKTFTNGVFDSADVTFPAVPAGNTAEAVVLAWDTGDDESSVLIAYWDTSVIGLPVTTNGEDINVAVNPSGWFSI